MAVVGFGVAFTGLAVEQLSGGSLIGLLWIGLAILDAAGVVWYLRRPVKR